MFFFFLQYMCAAFVAAVFYSFRLPYLCLVVLLILIIITTLIQQMVPLKTHFHNFSCSPVICLLRTGYVLHNGMLA